MDSRVTTAVAGTIIVLLGLAGLLYPGRIMGLLGFTVLNASQAAATLGEVRATYGGLFVVMGLFTILAAANPAAHRSRLLLIGLLWFGACAGRLLGVSVDGNPGLPGWLAVALEIVVGGALVAASFSKPAVAAPPAAVPFTSAPANPPA